MRSSRDASGWESDRIFLREAAVRTIVFVHGTGVRKASYDRTLAEIQRRVENWEGVRVEGCYWGDATVPVCVGGASVPTFDATRALDGEAGDPESDAVPAPGGPAV